MASRHSELVRLIGERMKKARELCNLSQQVAAARLHYANGSKLSKVENATNSNSVPIWLIVRASEVYQVSTDFLLGLTNSFERSIRISNERSVASWLYDEWQAQRVRDMGVFAIFCKRQDQQESSIKKIASDVDELKEAFRVFRNLNKFDELRGGARLYKAVGELTASTDHAVEQVKRFRGECLTASRGTPQLEILFDPDRKKGEGKDGKAD